MAFTGDEDHSISIEDASQLTMNCREQAKFRGRSGRIFWQADIIKFT